MKTAAERAREMRKAYPHGAHTGDLAKMLKDYAADMRSTVSDAVSDHLSEMGHDYAIASAIEAVRSTPFPGEQK